MVSILYDLSLIPALPSVLSLSLSPLRQTCEEGGDLGEERTRVQR